MAFRRSFVEVAAVVAYLALGTGLPLHAADPRFVLGIVGGIDLSGTAQLQPATASGEIFGRLFLGRNLALEASVGTRHSTYTDTSSTLTTTFDVRQTPVALGATWVFQAGQDFRLRAGGGAVISSTRTTATATLVPSPPETIQTSSTVVGPYVAFGAQLPLVDKVTLEVLLRYVWNPIPASTGRPTGQDYFWGMFGLSLPF